MISHGLRQTDWKEKIVGIIKQKLKLPHYKIFVFGSRVNGKAGERSDIDVGILSESSVPAGVLGDIREQLDELPILQKIDLVDFTRVSEEFRCIAMQNVEILYEQ